MGRKKEKEFTFMFRKTGLTGKEFKEKWPSLYKEELEGRRLERQEKERIKKDDWL